MTMAFRTVKTAIEGLLEAGAVAGGYRVAGSQTDKQAANQVKDSLRVVRVYYSEGNFPRSASSRNVSEIHDCKFNIELTTAKAATVDLSVLDDPNANNGQRAAVLDAAIDAAIRADDDIDQFIDVVNAILMSAANRNLGFSRGDVANTWIENISKGAPTPQGELMAITASMPFSCRVSEAIGGDAGKDADPTLKAVLANVEVWINENTADAGLAAIRGGN
jgi:hypothetical protein